MADRVRLGLHYNLVGTMLAPTLKAFGEACPRVDLTLICEPSPDLLTAVRRGRLDWVVIEETIGSETGEVLAIDRLVWVGAHGGSAQNRRSLPVSRRRDVCLPLLGHRRLARQGRESRTNFENGGLDVPRAMVRMDMTASAWLVVTVPDDLDVVVGAGLPDLPSFAITMNIRAGAQGPAIRELTHHPRQAGMSRLRQVA